MGCDMNEYQQRCLETAIYPNVGNNLSHAVHELTSEAGEVAGVVKRIGRDCGGVLTDEYRDRIKKEVGDVLWAAAMVCYEAGINLSDAAEANIAKLRDRQIRGVLQGSGDER